MNPMTIFPLTAAGALSFAVNALKAHGIKIAETPNEKVTHLLLSVPFSDADGSLEETLKRLPQDITVLGGYLTHPHFAGYEKIDLLHDAQYLAENADLTAEAALRLAENQLPVRLRGLPVLVIGWGRIGKCLAKRLQAAGAKVQVAARKETDRAMLQALGYEALSMEQMRLSLSDYRVIFNTAPIPVLTSQELQGCKENCIKIDLASVRGMEGEDVIWARGLPGKYLPESSGQLIADTIVRLCKKEGAK